MYLIFVRLGNANIVLPSVPKNKLGRKLHKEKTANGLSIILCL